MSDKIIKGTIMNKATGETLDIEPFHLFPNNCQLNAIVKILNVRESSYSNPDNSITREISVDCLALDCHGRVFKLNLYFLPECLDDEQKIISEITEGKILLASGRYTILRQGDDCIMLNDPKYFPLPPEYSLEEVEEVFRFNIASLIKHIRKVFENGDAEAQSTLGMLILYQLENGDPKYNNEAVQWLIKTAEQGNIAACTSLSWAFLEGKGVQQDYAEAAKWFRMAAEQGYEDAQLELDKMKDK